MTGQVAFIAFTLGVAVGCGRESDDGAPADAPDAEATRSDSVLESPSDAVVDAIDESPTPPTSLDYAPVCGTDGVTYWNDERAAAKGIASTSGACIGSRSGGPGACGPFIGKMCPAGTVCIGDYFYITPTYCTMTGDWNGNCWSIPPGATCPSSDKPSYFDCTTSSCATYCEVVRGVRSYRVDSACP